MMNSEKLIKIEISAALCVRVFWSVDISWLCEECCNVLDRCEECCNVARGHFEHQRD